MKVLDPIRLLSPFILQAKSLLRETWNVDGLGWDDTLPEKGSIHLMRFMGSLLELDEIVVPRSLWTEGKLKNYQCL